MTARLTIPQLEAFLKLAHVGSFRNAAIALGVSQPALSRTIQQIEARIGARLFDRDSRRVTLAPAGAKLLPIAERLLSDYDEAFVELRQFINGRNELIRVAAFPSIAATLLPEAISNFWRRMPSIGIDIWEDVGAPIHHATLEGSIDIGVATPPPLESELRFHQLLDEELVLVCRVDDPLAKAESQDWKVFAERPFISTSQETGLRAMIEEGLSQANVQADPILSCKQPATVVGLVRASLGIAALTKSSLASIASPDITWRPLKNPCVSRKIGIVTHARRPLSPASQLFVRELEVCARKFRSLQSARGSGGAE